MLSVATPELLLGDVFTKESVAVLSSTYMVFYAGGQLVNGFLGDMLSPKVMILGGIGLGGASMILFPFLPYHALRVICFALLGFGLSMLRGPLMKIISESTEPKHARLICVFFSFASFAGPLIASLFVMAFSAKYAFIASGAVAVFMALFAVMVLAVMQKRELITFHPIKPRGLSSITDVFRIEGFCFYMVVAGLGFLLDSHLSFGASFL